MAETRIDRRPVATDRRAVEIALRELISGVVERRTPGGASAFVDGPPGIGKLFLIGQILEPADAWSGNGVPVLRATGDHRRRNEPFATIEQLTGPAPGGSNQSDVAFDRIDMLALAGDRAKLAELRRRGLWPGQVLAVVLAESLTGDHRRDFHTDRLLRACQIRDVDEIQAREAARLRTATGRRHRYPRSTRSLRRLPAPALTPLCSPVIPATWPS